MRLIDADALIKTIKDSDWYKGDVEYAMYANGFIDDIKAMPTIEPSAVTEVTDADLIRRSDAVAYLTDNMTWYTEDGYEADDNEKYAVITDLVNALPTADRPQGAMEYEIQFMREWDKWLQEQLSKEQYDFFAQGFARTKSYEWLKDLGATDEEAAEACDYVDKTMRGGTP